MSEDEQTVSVSVPSASVPFDNNGQVGPAWPEIQFHSCQRPLWTKKLLKICAPVSRTERENVRSSDK